MSLELEDLLDLYEKYPIGSRVVIKISDHSHINKGLSCKVVGYHCKYGTVLVYNPNIDGHDGYGNAVNELGDKLSLEVIQKNYQDHCWYTSPEDQDVGGQYGF